MNVCVRIVAALALAFCACVVHAERVLIALPDGVLLTAHWKPHPTLAIAPAAVALHGCGGLYRRDGVTLDDRYPEYVARLHAAGFHVLLPDSFGSRSTGSICTLPPGTRTVSVAMRRGDAIAAVRWLAERHDVDSQRIVLIGWSHGAMTALAALNSASAPSASPLAAAIVFYPGCSQFAKSTPRISAPLLVLLGEKDDWTPPAPCIGMIDRMRQQQPDADLTLRVYPDSYHGFDRKGPVRVLRDVSNGVDPTGVHNGGNAAARAAALAEFDAFLASRVLQVQAR